jgi:hypothetical protein
MTSFRAIRSFLVPTGSQIIASLVVALVYLGLYFHDALLNLITGAAGTKQAYLQQSYNDQVSAIGQLSFTKDLTIGIFWAGVGIVGYFVVITLVNLLIALRNEVVIDKMYASSGGFLSHLTEPLVRLVLIVVFAVGSLITLEGLIPGVWLPLFGNLLLGDYSATGVGEAILAVIGFTFNVYLIGLLFLAIKNTDEFV